MERCNRGFPPTRRIAYPISMGHYRRSLVLGLIASALVAALGAAAAKDAKLAKMLADGVKELNAAVGVDFVDLSDGNKLAVLKANQGGAFFQKVRGTCVVSLYNQPLVWRHFGYEGPSADFGGYIERGFDDANWLPTPPEDASPKPE